MVFNNIVVIYLAPYICMNRRNCDPPAYVFGVCGSSRNCHLDRVSMYDFLPLFLLSKAMLMYFIVGYEKEGKECLLRL